MAVKQSFKNIHRLIESATESASVNDAFAADLKASIEKMDALDEYKPSRTYKPSSLVCMRNMYFQIIGAPVDKDRSSACLVGICESGSDRHERIQAAVSNMNKIGINCEYVDIAAYIKQRGLTHLVVKSKGKYETKLFYPELNMSFLCDGIIKYKGQYYILEIKTESIYKWQKREDIASEHIPQGTAYSVAFGIDKVMFLYENRDNCDKKAYLLNVTEDMKFDLIRKIEDCDGYKNRLIPPPMPEVIPKKACQYCKYVSSCKQAGR